MKPFRMTLIILSLSLSGCEKVKVDKSDERYVPTDVLVKIKGSYKIDKAFDFINRFDHSVESISSLTYTSNLPPDSLQYVLDLLNAKAYTNDSTAWPVTGYLNHQTNAIIVFPRLFEMNNISYQTDWLESVDTLKLNEDTTCITAGCIIYFHVPAGREKEWIKTFEEYDIVERTELNHIIEISSLK